MAEFSRPASAFRFKMLGVKTNAAPDALAEYKYPYAQNTRPYTTDELQTRPSLAQTFRNGGLADTSLANQQRIIFATAA